MVLTPQEVRALQVLTSGRDQEQAARLLGISARTYRRLLAVATAKLGCRAPVQAAALAAQARVISVAVGESTPKEPSRG